MFSVKTLASTLAAASLVSVIGLAYAQTTGQPSSDPATTGSSTDPSIQSPSNPGDTTMPNNSTSTQGTTTTLDNSTGTQRSTMSSDNNLRADGSSELEPRADRN